MMVNKENNKVRGNRKMAFQRRRKPLNVDPNAAMNNFFGTVGSPIKMAKPFEQDRPPAAPVDKLAAKMGAVSVNSEAVTLDVKQKVVLREEIKKQQRQQQMQKQREQDEERARVAAKAKAEEARAKAQATAAADAALEKAAAAGEDDVATVKQDGRRKERRNSTELFFRAPIEPVQQLKLDGAKKAKIPHFMSAWFNAGNDTRDADASAAAAATPAPKPDAAPVVPAVARAPPQEAPVAAPPAPVEKPLAINPRNNYSQSIDFSEIKLGRMIGEGAFGKVHEGKWRGKAVAVKLLICQDLRSDILHEFQSEVEIMSVLRHPNICRLLGACMEPPHRALVVELLQRGSLWGVLRMNRKSIDQEMRSRFIYDTAKGMSYLHHFERPILHRDLKSPNLLVDKNFTIKLSDFGLARVKAHVQTMTGNCGTVQWMAPEVLGNQKYTEKADVFSFGIVIWEIVTGECPYDGMSQIQAALGVLNRNLRPNIPRDCPPFFSRLMKACWNRQPELRPSFPHIVNAFRTYQQSISESRATSEAAASAQAAMAASIAAS